MNCHSCKSKLVSATNDPDTQYQFDNALWIHFEGGYGMFVDDVEAELTGSLPRHRVVICHECAHSLCDAISWIKELLEPHSSHSHTVEYEKTHPDHIKLHHSQ